jgi:hypothetical protein
MNVKIILILKIGHQLDINYKKLFKDKVCIYYVYGTPNCP